MNLDPVFDEPDEWMDREGWPDETLKEALASLERSHRWLGTYRRLTRLLRSNLPSGRTSVVLDIGGADGRFGSYLEEHLPAVRYFSLDPKAIRWNRLNERSGYVTASAPPLPFRTGSVDAVVSLLTLHHLPEADLPALLRESVRVANRLVLHEDLRPGRFARLLTVAFSRMISRNPIFRHDAGLSVRASRSVRWWRRLLTDYDLPYEVRTRFPFRCQLIHET